MKEKLATPVRWLLLVVGIPVGLYLGKSFLIPLAIGMILAMMLNPVLDWLLRKKVGEGWAITACTLLVVLFFVFLGGLLAFQVGAVAEDWPQMQQKANEMLDQLQGYIQEQFGLSPQKQIEEAKKLLTTMGSGGGAILGALVSGVTGFLLMIVYVVLLLSQRERIKGAILKAVPKAEQPRAHKALKEIRETAGGYLWGILKVISILAAMYAVGFLIGGVKYAVLIALITALFAIIPYLGNIIGGSLACLLALVSGDSSSVLVVLGVMTVAQVVESYFLEPLIVGRQVGLNPFITIACVVGFSALWGPVGAIIAIPLTSILQISFKYLPGTEPLAYLMGKEEE
ncbi:AI-2E family transporter [Rhabdobacter roseus]|uniref:Putative PurR-regulated permease PerM n=1 Tax=Rhabdobacter roseus TaxID=1655419 RepID=A0A840TJ08_9BACT|nr:AI-2E family transporter [Rhabdobacter roseus]MBB5284176.1 putative PurR-regulated permease PerM [Rhabdobacter roseus]